MRSWILPLLPWLVPVVTSAQQPASAYFTTTVYGVEQGLPHRDVRWIEQDAQGLIWLATTGGLVRYDGYRFVVFGEEQGLRGHVVLRVIRDADGMLWLNYADGQVDILDPRSGRATPLAIYLGEGWPAHMGEPLYADGVSDDGSIVLSKNDRIVIHRSRREAPRHYQVAGGRNLRVVRIADNGDLWCARVPETRVHTWHQDVVRVPLSAEPNGAVLTPDIILPREVSTAMNGVDRSLASPLPDPGFHYTTAEHPYWMDDPGRVVPYPGHHMFDRQGAYIGMVRVPIAEDLWLVDHTVRRYRPGDDPLAAPVLHDLAVEAPELRQQIHCVLRDRAHDLWIGGEFGLCKVDMRMERFSRLLHTEQPEEGLGTAIRGMLAIGDVLHVQTERKGFHRFNTRTGEVLGAASDRSQRYAIARNDSGSVWRHTDDHLVRDDPGGGTTVSRYAPALGGVVWSMFDPGNGLLLLHTQEGMAMLTAAGPRKLTHPDHPELDAAIALYHLRHNDGSIWTCTDRGLYRLKEDGTVLERFWRGGTGRHALPADDIRHLFPGADDMLWLSTAHHGLLRWHPGSGSVRAFTTAQGLPGNSVYAAYGDGSGNLWMPTDRGLVRLDTATGKVRVFTRSDGLAHDEFNRLAHTSDANGKLYFGGLNGITVLDPAGFSDSVMVPPPPFVLLSVRQHHGAAEGPADITLPTLQGEALVVRPNDRYLLLEFALLSYSANIRHRYAWRLEGVDTEWNVQNEPSLRLTTLPYGRRMLHLRAYHRDGSWSDEIRIPLIVLRPWYLRWWAFASVAFLLAGIGYGLVRNRLRAMGRILRTREAIARDLHDEVGSTLSSVALFSTVMTKRSADRPDDERNMLQRIAESSTAALESINDVVWSVDARYDSVADVFARMEAFAGLLSDAHHWELHLRLPPELYDIKLGMAERKDLYLLFKEALNNAAKHAACSRMDVSLVRVGQQLELTVVDNGVGYARAERPTTTLGGHGMENMERRAAALHGTLSVEGSPGGGTTIRLRFRPQGR